MRFTLTDSPLFVHACHCLKCQKQSGSVFAITTIVLEKDIELQSGTLSVTPVPGAPHRFMHQCPQCGVTVYVTATNHPATALLAAGLLDDPRDLAIDAHIFVKRKRAWLTLPENVPQFDTFYDRDACWPQASLDRLAHESAQHD